MTIGASMSIADELNLKPQTRQVLAHLKGGRALTPLKARAVYGVESLSSRISEIANAGYAVSRLIVKDESGKRYASYALA